MRVLSTISKNTIETYKIPKNTFKQHGKLLSDDFTNWDKNVPQSLKELCVETLAKNFEDNPILSELKSDSDKYLLLDLLSTELQLPLTVSAVEDDIYWKRCYETRWPKAALPNRKLQKFSSEPNLKKQTIKNISEKSLLLSPNIVKTSLLSKTSSKSDVFSFPSMSPRSELIIDSYYEPMAEKSWKQCYLEKHLQEVLENLEPESYEPETIKKLYELCGSYVTTLRLEKLCAANDTEKGIDHIPLKLILSGLPNLSELDICFKQTYVGEKFSWHVLKTSVNDVQILGKGLEKLNLHICRIRNSDIDCTKASILLKSLIKNVELKSLDFSHCKISDNGAIAIGKFALEHPALDTVILTNNRIGEKGARSFAYVLCQSGCKLGHLDLRLNPIRPAGANHIISSLIKGSESLRSLSLAGCGLNRENHLVGKMLKFNKHLEYFDLSSNHLGEDVAKEIVNGLVANNTVKTLDVRMCDVTPETEYLIRQELITNRKHPKRKAIEIPILDEELKSLANIEKPADELEISTARRKSSVSSESSYKSVEDVHQSKSA